MEPQSNMTYQFTEISNDVDLFSLFNMCEEQLELKEQNKQIQIQTGDLIVNAKDIAKGYCSDQQIFMKGVDTTRKHKAIINKKQKKKTKKRTKIYIEMLQAKINDLQNEIERLKKLNRINKQYIHRLGESQHVINGYIVGRQQVIQKLQVLNSQEQVDSTKIKEEIISLRLRQGVFGKDRVKAVNYYFKQMVEMVLPDIQKYIIKTAIENSDFFDIHYLRNGRPSQQVQDWRKRMLENIGSEMKQKSAKQYLFNNRDHIMRQTQKFKQILVKFCNTKCSLMEQAKKLQQVFDGAHKFMKPLQVSKSLCYIDKFRFQKNISLQQTFNQVFQQMSQKSYAYEIDRPFCI